MPIITRLLVVGSAVVISASVVVAQGAAGPAFEVASLKPTNTAGVSLVNLYPGGRLRATNFTLHGLITRAWGIRDTQLDGEPNWFKTQGFDIEVKAEGNPSNDQVWLMLRTLLTERFNLATRTEKRELPVYELLHARSDRKLGPSLRPSAGADCVKAAPGGAIGAPDPAHPSCGMLYSPTGHWVGRGVTMDSLARGAVRETGRVVLNRTDLPGTFDLDLQWTDLSTMLRPNAPNSQEMAVGGPSFYTALQEQLGLKLEATRGLVDVLIIERAEMPAADAP